jgi:hypothetical protein
MAPNPNDNAKATTDTIKQNSICYVTDTHAYYVQEEKLKRLQLDHPADTSQQEEFFKLHADLVEERREIPEDDDDRGPAPMTVIRILMQRAVAREEARRKVVDDRR